MYYDKFKVERRDGSVKHTGCKYLVLDLTHLDDPTVFAVRMYADAVQHSNPQLAEDLYDIVGRNPFEMKVERAAMLPDGSIDDVLFPGEEFDEDYISEYNIQIVQRLVGVWVPE